MDKGFCVKLRDYWSKPYTAKEMVAGIYKHGEDNDGKMLFVFPEFISPKAFLPGTKNIMFVAPFLDAAVEGYIGGMSLIPGDMADELLAKENSNIKTYLDNMSASKYTVPEMFVESKYLSLDPFGCRSLLCVGINGLHVRDSSNKHVKTLSGRCLKTVRDEAGYGNVYYEV